MYLNYAKIKNGQKKQPMLRLRTLAGKELGVVPFVHNLAFEINYADVSTIEFTTPYKVNGMLNPLYAALTSFKVVYTEELGIYVLASPKKSGNGVEESKVVTGYSLEQMFKKKDLFLEEGTYNFWNPVASEDTILGRVIELDPSWRVGYVAPRLIGCYRTFDQYDSDALSFCYGDAMEKYRCAFVFDVYEKTINVYDAVEEPESLPIYLSYNNLIEAVDVEELSDDIATKLHLSGSDGLTIRDVNPTGKDYIVNLDYFLHNGDLDIKVGNSTQTLAERVQEWQASIAARQTYYTGLVAARASLTAQKLAAEVDLTTLKSELDDLTNQQSVIIQALAMETTDAGKATQQSKLNTINSQITAKNTEISNQEAKISYLASEIDDYMKTLSTINGELSFEGFFSKEEQAVLNPYMIDASVNDETFVATDVDTTVSSAVSTVSGAVSVTDSDLTRVELTSFNKTMYVISGGTLTVPNAGITATIIRGTLEVSGSGYVMTAYLGTTDYNGRNFSTGLITIAGILSQLTSNVAARTQDGIMEYKGTQFSFQTTSADTYFTVSVSDYQKYSVAMELYDFGEEVLDDYAWPVYEFGVDSANFLYHEKFEPFKNKLELGKAVHLDLGSEGLISAKIIGVKLNFEDISNFSLVFSNRYQKKNGKKILAELANATAKSKQSINASKYTYNRAADKVTEVSDIIQQQLVAAVNNIVNKEDQTVLINSSGINIGGSSNYQMRLVDNMIAMTDDGWKTAKLAIGLFATKDVGTQWGVNAEMLAGNILIGNKLILQNPNDDGYMMFQIDETGAWLYNAQFVLQDEKTGGLIIIDPKYGIVSGTKLLFDANGTTVTPEFMDGAGNITFDSEGMPMNANFFLDLRDGKAYFRGAVYAESGIFRGDVYADNGVFKGTVYATDGEFNGTVYATDGEFTGKVTAMSGTFKGTVQAEDFLDSSGSSMLEDGKWSQKHLNIKSLNINDRFIVDENGNVSMSGGISWGTSPVQYQYSKDGVNWHDTFVIGDIYRRESFDGKTWGTGYQFIGTNGANGEDGKDGEKGEDGVGVESIVQTTTSSVSGGTNTVTVTLTNGVTATFNIKNGAKGDTGEKGEKGEAGSDAAITHATMLAAMREAFDSGIQTFITADAVGSPTLWGGNIYGAAFHGNEFNIYPETTGDSGSMSMWGWYDSRWLEVFKLEYVAANAPYAVFSSPCSGYASWEFSETKFRNHVKFYGLADFSSASVDGIYGYGSETPSEWQAWEETYGTAFGDNGSPREGFIYFQMIE